NALNCTLPAILEFPNLMRRKSIGWAITTFLLTMYLFVGLAIVCDNYLVPAMERLCFCRIIFDFFNYLKNISISNNSIIAALRMTYDVAGATFLAGATSAPELFINFIGTFVTHGDIGIGTIVGSSVFNVLVIAAICGILTPPSQLDWWPVTRDCIWYIVAIAILTATLWDSLVLWYESMVLLIIYVFYLLFLILDRRIQGCIRKRRIESELMDEDPMEREEEPLKSFRDNVCGTPEPDSNCCEWIWWAFKYPFNLIFALTIPSVRGIYFLSMLMAVIWISIISYMLSWFLTIVGYNLGVPDSIMGLTVLAAGTSVPEVASSYIVSKKGYGSMAICNAIGSNTIDILICLGVPWFLKNMIYMDFVYIDSTAITFTTGMLLFTVFIVYSTFLCTRFVMGKPLGWICLIAYILFLAGACTMEIVLNDTVYCDIEE
ncbi:hypothetical protein KR026_006957, partial [Drosophila bipectinata]